MYVTVVHKKVQKKKTAALDTHGITIYTDICVIGAYNHHNKNCCHTCMYKEYMYWIFGIYL